MKTLLQSPGQALLRTDASLTGFGDVWEGIPIGRP